MVSKRRMSKRKSVRKNRKGSKRRSYKKTRGGEIKETKKNEMLSLKCSDQYNTFDEFARDFSFTSEELDAENIHGLTSKTFHTDCNAPQPSVLNVEDHPEHFIPSADLPSEPYVEPVAPSYGVKTSEEKNTEFIRKMREAEEEKKRQEAEEESRLPLEVLEKKRLEEAEAAAHDQSKTNHLTRLGSTFAMKGQTALGRGRGRGRAGGSRRRQRGGGRGHGR